MTLYKYLTQFLEYSEAEAEETVIRFEQGMNMPDEVLKDIGDYYEHLKLLKKAERIKKEEKL